MAKKFTFRGKTLEELQRLDIASLLPLFAARQRRSLTRGMTPTKKLLLAKVVAKAQGTYKKEIRTQCRDMVILPAMVGQLLHVYNGKEFVPLSIQPEMIGNFLGGSIVYPACGISFGLDRIVLALGEKNAPATLTFVYVIPVGNTVADALALTSALRTSGISTEVDLVGKSPSKNLDYAAKLGIPYVVFVGAQELAAKAVKVRNMDSGVETLVPQRKLASEIKKLLKTL